MSGEFEVLQDKSLAQQYGLLRQMFAFDDDIQTFTGQCIHHYRRALRWDMRRKAPLETFKRIEALGIPQVCVADGELELVTANLRVLEIEDEIKFFISGADVRGGKPHPEPYEQALSRLGLPPESCLAVEDSLTGVESAAAAGIATIAWPLPGADIARFHRADLVIAFLGDFPWGLLRRQQSRTFFFT